MGWKQVWGVPVPSASCAEVQAGSPEPGALSPLCHQQLNVTSSPAALGHQCLPERVAPSHSVLPAPLPCFSISELWQISD